MANLHGNIDVAKEINALIDQNIFQYIIDNPDGDFSAAVNDDERLEVLYHLSDLPAGLFAWYDFKPGASLLEIGAGFGERTGSFCERCAHVTVLEESPFRAKAIWTRYKQKENLDVFCGEFSVFPQAERFDYIIVSGMLGRVSEPELYLQTILKLLEDDGVLLIAEDNRFGGRYFCGERAGNNMPFEGINGKFSAEHFFSRQELLDMIHNAGAEKVRVYYPLPDYHLPQLIYSDEHLPGKELKERLITYYQNRDTFLIHEDALLYEAVSGGAFPFMANSFVLECGKEENLSTAVYAVLSTDRGKDRAFATVLYKGNVAKKRPVFSEGIGYAKKVFQQGETLRERNIPVIEQRWENNSILMPYVKAAMLNDVLREAVNDHDKEKLFYLIECLWQYILRSGDEIPSENNVLLTEDTKNLPWGPIFKETFLEIISLNCFFDKGRMLFFDQEYVSENYPAKYVLFRALLNIYSFVEQIETFIPITEFKQKYGLCELWDIFMAAEMQFLDKVRCHKKYQQFYKRTILSEKQMKVNAALLGTEASGLLEYCLSMRLKAVWDIQLDLLKEIKRVCEKYNLRYYLAYGTLLGAVRHGGFIPWDDDADIVMPRSDFDRLQELAETEFKEPYYLQTMNNDESTFYNGFMKFRNKNTTAIGRDDFAEEGVWGIWVDILPLDVCPKGGEAAIDEKVKRVKKWQMLLQVKVYGERAKAFREITRQKKKDSIAEAESYSYDELCAHLHSELIGVADGEIDTSRFAVFTHYNSKKVFFRQDYDETIFVPFNGLRLAAPKGYKRCLQMSIGNNYMQPPPLEERMSHHGKMIFNVKVSYCVYNDLFTKMFAGSEGKKLIIFGAGNMLADYLKKHGDRHSPDYVLDNDRRKWGKLFQGIEVRSPESLRNERDFHLIICSTYYHEIEKQLHDMGIFSYKIYVQNKDWAFETEMKYSREI